MGVLPSCVCVFVSVCSSAWICMSKLSLAQLVCICTWFHECMHECDHVRVYRVHVYAQMERWIQIVKRSFHTDKHIKRYVHEHIHVRARTESLSAASAPRDSSFATVLFSPLLLAMCSAERWDIRQIGEPSTTPAHGNTDACRGTYTHMLVPCAHFPFHARPCIHYPPAPLTPHTPNHVSSVTCRSRAPAFLVASNSSAAAASFLFWHATIRAVAWSASSAPDLLPSPPYMCCEEEEFLKDASAWAFSSMRTTSPLVEGGPSSRRPRPSS